MSRVVALVPDLFFGSKVEATLQAAGHEVWIAGTSEAGLTVAADADLVIADLHAEGLDAEALRSRVAGRPVIGFYSHVDADAKRRGEEAGFDLVVPRSRFAREMPSLVERLLGRT